MKLFDVGRREMKKCRKIARAIDALAAEYKTYSDEQLQAKTPEFRQRLAAGEALDDLLVEAFATVREAATRTLFMTPFFVQLVGAVVLHRGNVAEMKTGEGKTLTSTLVAYLNALPGEGVHIVTVNEYLAGRDAKEMGVLFNWLGLSVGLNLRELTAEEKRAAYNCDITYSTNSELGFDYLRDHMVLYKEDMVQKPLNFAIVDEVDSILIDEARTPLIISGGARNTGNLYSQADLFAKRLKKEEDYTIDVTSRTVALTEPGIEKAERFFNLGNLYDLDNVNLLHRINNALKANYIFEKNIDYVVQDETVVIVDAFTGRLMHGRQWSEGLHQAIEAKEHVEVKSETRTVATITFQNFFRMYKKLSGMTGTAKTEEEEFRQIYNMFVVEIPTNMPVIRIDAPDSIFSTKRAKFEALADDIAARHRAGQPVLVGTVAIETSEHLSALLRRRGVPHNLLNAKQHEREAEIVAHAGERGAVTIATNMAGRGTDIKLGPGVVELGGLAVLGSERHEARRIDNQLRGRSGRQGDPGYTKFYLSAEDDLMARFGSERFKTMLAYATASDQGEVALESKMFSRFVESAQKRIEGNNYDARKGVLEYDEVLRVQREIIYKERNELLFLADIRPLAEQMFQRTAEGIVSRALNFEAKRNRLDVAALLKLLNGGYFAPDYFREADFAGRSESGACEKIFAECNALLDEKVSQFGAPMIQEFLKVIMLRVIDSYWMNHIDEMDELRQAVGLQSYAEINPLREYQEIGYEKFTTMISNINSDVTRYVNRAQIQANLERQAVVKNIHAASGGEKVAKKQPKKAKDKTGRNDPCPCGSGKKYKNCCGR